MRRAGGVCKPAYRPERTVAIDAVSVIKMKDMRRVLFVSQGLVDESGALQQALSIARNQHATLRVLQVLPQFPPALSAYTRRFEDLQRERFTAEFARAREALGLPEPGPPMTVLVQQADVLAIRIVQQVLKNADDLVVKAAEPDNGRRVISAVDLDLLRQCPVPVWLARPIARHRGEIRVAVAIDALDRGIGGQALSLRLLQAARELADTCSGELGVISCWDYPLERYLRRNAWFRISERELDEQVMSVETEHREALEKLIRESGVGGSIRVMRAQGDPAERIPHYVSTHEVDILVLGTVARTGLPGLLMGNTAERILQSLECSLLAFKPAGFVSGVRVE